MRYSGLTLIATLASLNVSCSKDERGALTPSTVFGCYQVANSKGKPPWTYSGFYSTPVLLEQTSQGNLHARRT